MKQDTLTRISIENAEFYAYHGVKKEEKKLGGKFQVDVDLTYDAKEAILKDSINAAINYEEVVFEISEIISGESFDLIETLASEILNALFDKFELIQECTIRIRKMNVPMRRIVSFVEVEQSMIRS